MSWPCINDATCTQIAREAVGAIIGPENITVQEATMGHESYSILAAYYPSVMCALGAGNEEKGMTVGGHNPKHEPDEDCLKFGVAATVAYVKAFLEYKHHIPFQPFQGKWKNSCTRFKEGLA